ncbi:MAG: PadR family transcriptional regulator [Rhodothermales bacterium]
MFSKPLVAASLEPLMLSLLSEGEMYGYQIIQRVKELSDGQIVWNASKLYPLLHKLENKGLVKAHWEMATGGGLNRKYYRLTPKGKAMLETHQREWRNYNAILVQLWGPQLLPSE